MSNYTSLQGNDDPHVSAAEALPTIREAVSACYLVRLKLLNGGPWYQDEQCRIRLELSRELISLAIQNNIEGALIGEYGAEQGVENSADMLSAMLDGDFARFAETCGLSELGITVMGELFKSLSEMAYEALSQGKPLTATMNQLVH